MSQMSSSPFERPFSLVWVYDRATHHVTIRDQRSEHPAHTPLHHELQGTHHSRRIDGLALAQPGAGYGILGLDGPITIEVEHAVQQAIEHHLGGSHTKLGAEDDYDYRGQHTAPGPDFGWQIHDMENPELTPGDFYTNPQYYMFNDRQYDQESLRAINQVRDNPDAQVTIHRAGPVGQINSGDWVTPSHAYARHHALHPTDPAQDGPVWSAQVPAHTLWTSGDDLNEFGYHGPALEGQRTAARKTADAAINQADATNDPLGKSPALEPSRMGDPDYLEVAQCPVCYRPHRPDEPCPESSVAQYEQMQRQWSNRDPNAIHGAPEGLGDHQVDLGKTASAPDNSIIEMNETIAKLAAAVEQMNQPGPPPEAKKPRKLVIVRDDAGRMASIEEQA